MTYAIKSTENSEHIITEVNRNMMKHHIGESARQKVVRTKRMQLYTAEVRQPVKRKPNVTYAIKSTENSEHIITEVNGNMMEHHIGESVRQKDVQRKQMWLNTVEVRQLIRKKPSVLYVKLAMVK